MRPHLGVSQGLYGARLSPWRTSHKACCTSPIPRLRGRRRASCTWPQELQLCRLARRALPTRTENATLGYSPYLVEWAFSAPLCQAAPREAACESSRRHLKTASETRLLRHRSASLRDLPSAIFLR